MKLRKLLGVVSGLALVASSFAGHSNASMLVSGKGVSRVQDIARSMIPNRIVINGREAIADEINVKFRGYNFSVSGGKLTSPEPQAVRDLGCKIVGSNASIGWHTVKLPSGGSVVDMVQKFKARPDVEFAEPNYVVRIFNDPSPVKPLDDLYPLQYAYSYIHQDLIWNYYRGANNTGHNLIAVVDTGIDLTHPKFLGRIAAVANFTPALSAQDDHGHGTHCSGIAAAESSIGGSGTVGDSWNARIVAAKVLDSTGAGLGSWVSNGITFAANMGAQVISLSLGGYYYDAIEASAVQYAIDHDCLVCAAAGNDGQFDLPVYPAGYPGVLSVASSNYGHQLSFFSNWGDMVSVSAPGEEIWSTWPLQFQAPIPGYNNLSGTSMATPLVAGALVNLRAAFPSIPAKRWIQYAERSATPEGWTHFGAFDAWKTFLYAISDIDIPCIATNLLGTVDPTSKQSDLITKDGSFYAIYGTDTPLGSTTLTQMNVPAGNLNTPVGEMDLHMVITANYPVTVNLRAWNFGTQQYDNITSVLTHSGGAWLDTLIPLPNPANYMDNQGRLQLLVRANSAVRKGYPPLAFRIDVMGVRDHYTVCPNSVCGP
ncbi:MAG: S8 family serine peptidase [Armatimonadetes bacterium]|nr:S8 family serine peptidase [Armatimonadota bacterium]